MALTSAQQSRLDELKNIVSLRLDEVSDSADQIGADDINFGDIEHELHESVRKVLTSVDPITVMASAVKTSSLTVMDGINGSILVPLPSDFVRFIQLKVTGWKRPVTSLLTQENPEYERQQFAVNRARSINPIGFVVPNVSDPQGTVPNGFVLVENNGSVAPPVGEKLSSASKEIVITDNNSPVDGMMWAYVTGDVPSVGDTLSYIPAPGTNYEVIVRYDAYDTYGVESSNLAVEAYPKATGTLEELVYIPLMKAYDAPSNLKDAIAWYATYKVLIIGERIQSAQLALGEFEKSIQQINQGVRYGGS